MIERTMKAYDLHLFKNLNEVDDSPEKIEWVKLGAMKAAIAAMWTPFDPEDEKTWPGTIQDVLIFYGGRPRIARWGRGSAGIPNQWYGDSGWSSDRPTGITHYQEITQERDDE